MSLLRQYRCECRRYGPRGDVFLLHIGPAFQEGVFYPFHRFHRNRIGKRSFHDQNVVGKSDGEYVVSAEVQDVSNFGKLDKGRWRSKGHYSQPVRYFEFVFVKQTIQFDLIVMNLFFVELRRLFVISGVRHREAVYAFSCNRKACSVTASPTNRVSAECFVF